MGLDQKFQQHWEFMRRDNNFDSSSNDSKSVPATRPAFKKHKLVSDLIMPENDKMSDASRPQQKGEFISGMGIHLGFGKTNIQPIGMSNRSSGVKNKTKGSSWKGGNKKKNKLSICKPVELDDFRIITRSILEELEIARENMFARMRVKMNKLVYVKSELSPTSTQKEDFCLQKAGHLQLQNTLNQGWKLKISEIDLLTGV